MNMIYRYVLLSKAMFNVVNVIFSGVEVEDHLN